MGEVSALGNATHGDEAEPAPPTTTGENDMTDASAVRSDLSANLSANLPTSAVSETPIGPALQMNVLGAARAAAELASYVGVCPTCLAWHDPAALTPEHESVPGRAVCPTCEQCSVEWDLAVAIDDQVEEIRALTLLDEAVQAEKLAADDARPGSPSQLPRRGV